MKYNSKRMYHPPRLAMLSLVCLIIVTSCQKDEEIVEEMVPREVGYPGVDEELWPFFSRFEEEGFARGITVNLRLANITGQIQEIEEHRVLGRCSFDFRQPNRVTIDAAFWNQSSDRGREFVVFHELGHCFLNRAHREDTDRRGLCLSIMRSGTGTCRDNYNQFTRTQYLDELFDSRFADDIFE